MRKEIVWSEPWYFIHKIYLSMLGYSTLCFSIFWVSSTLRTKQFCTLISNSMKSIETKSTKIFNSEMLTQVTSLEKGFNPSYLCKKGREREFDFHNFL